jgi:hypothetical protein
MGTLEYMSTKWFSKFERQSDNLLMSSVKGPCSFQWRDNQFPASSDVKLCVEQLQHTKSSPSCWDEGLCFVQSFYKAKALKQSSCCMESLCNLRQLQIGTGQGFLKSIHRTVGYELMKCGCCYYLITGMRQPCKASGSWDENVRIRRGECSLLRTKPLAWNSIEIMNFSFPRWE